MNFEIIYKLIYPTLFGGFDNTFFSFFFFSLYSNCTCYTTLTGWGSRI